MTYAWHNPLDNQPTNQAHCNNLLLAYGMEFFLLVKSSQAAGLIPDNEKMWRFLLPPSIVLNRDWINKLFWYPQLSYHLGVFYLGCGVVSYISPFCKRSMRDHNGSFFLSLLHQCCCVTWRLTWRLGSMCTKWENAKDLKSAGLFVLNVSCSLQFLIVIVMRAPLNMSILPQIDELTQSIELTSITGLELHWQHNP